MTSIQEQNRKKGGRPPTGRVRKLSKSVTVKFSKPSYEALKLRARKANRKLAEYIRESALNGEVVSGHNTETVAIAKNLIGMANNLNQLTKLSHQRGFLPWMPMRSLQSFSVQTEATAAFWAVFPWRCGLSGSRIRSAARLPASEPRS